MVLRLLGFLAVAVARKPGDSMRLQVSTETLGNAGLGGAMTGALLKQPRFHPMGSGARLAGWGGTG